MIADQISETCARLRADQRQAEFHCSNQQPMSSNLLRKADLQGNTCVRVFVKQPAEQVLQAVADLDVRQAAPALLWQWP